MNLDQFYTREEDAKSCLKRLESFFSLDDFDRIVEPSAGTGIFSDLLPKEKTESLDLDPKRDFIREQDFFDYYPSSGSNILTIGNPPFGRRGILAKKFIEHAAQYSSVICFVLPSLFNKSSMIKSIPSKWHLVDNEVRVSEFVLPNKDVRKVGCTFQIWEKRDYHRKDVSKPKTHEDFIIRHAHMSRVEDRDLEKLRSISDFCIGQITGNVTDLETTVRGSQYFIEDRTPDKRVREIFETIDKTPYEECATIGGIVSFSRQDLVESYCKKSGLLSILPVYNIVSNH